MQTLTSPEPAVRPRPREPERRPLRVLLVEDNMVLRRALLSALTKAGLDARATRDGIDAVKSAFKDGIDLIVAEENLPGMRGLALARSLGVLPHPPRIILMTSSPSLPLRQEATKAGVEAVLPKPINFDFLKRIAGRTRKDILLPLRRALGSGDALRRSA